MEISEIEERKNHHIDDLRKNHHKAFEELKNYYNDITLNNLALISSLKVLHTKFFAEILFIDISGPNGNFT